VEFQLYLLYIPLIFVTKKFGWKPTIALAFLLESCIRIAEAYELMRFGRISIWLAGCPFTYIFSWSIGALIADNCIRDITIKPNKSWISIMILTGIGSQFIKPASTFGFMTFSMASAMMISHVYSRSGQTNWRIGRLISLGVASYSVYLIHQPIIQLVPKVYHYCKLDEMHPLIVFITCVYMIVPIFWCSLIMRKVVELPSVNMGYRLLAMLGQPRRQPRTLPV
jgi:peptidoglycan/LPS O-acetylase OafA/YrhL